MLECLRRVTQGKLEACILLSAILKKTGKSEQRVSSHQDRTAPVAEGISWLPMCYKEVQDQRLLSWVHFAWPAR